MQTGGLNPRPLPLTPFANMSSANASLPSSFMKIIIMFQLFVGREKRTMQVNTWNIFVWLFYMYPMIPPDLGLLRF